MSKNTTPSLYINDPDLWARVDEEATRRGLVRESEAGPAPNRSKMAAVLLGEALDASGDPAPSLASQAVGGAIAAGAVRERVMAALVLSGGVINKAAESLGASDRDMRRAIKVLGLGPEIKQRWKGATS